MKRFAAALSQHPVAAVAVGEIVGEVLERVGEEPDLVALFATEAYAGALEDAARVVVELLKPGVLIGCNAESVVCNAQEVESQPAITIWAGHVGPTLAVELWSGPDREVLGWPSTLPFDPSGVVLLADPFTFDAGAFFALLEPDHPGVPVIGGNASGARGPGGARLVFGPGVRTAGAAAVVLGPGAGLTPLVSQGCRPVGPPWTVTAADGPWLCELGGQRAWDRLAQMAEQELTPAERARVERGLHLGVLVDEHKADFGPGDFLIHTVRGANREAGALAVDAALEVGQTVQFHVRDADAADADLNQALLAHASGDTEGVLLFTCNGRGTRLFPEPHHDAATIADLLAAPATAGFFAQGEFGPVGGHNHVHGFSASMALFGARVGWD